MHSDKLKMSSGHFCVIVSLCRPTVAVSIRSGRAKRESSPIFGYLGRRYFSTKSCSTNRGISTPSSETVSTCTIPCPPRSEEHTSELQSRLHLVCRLLLEKKKNNTSITNSKIRST